MSSRLNQTEQISSIVSYVLQSWGDTKHRKQSEVIKLFILHNHVCFAKLGHLFCVLYFFVWHYLIYFDLKMDVFSLQIRKLRFQIQEEKIPYFFWWTLVHIIFLFPPKKAPKLLLQSGIKKKKTSKKENIFSFKITVVMSFVLSLY